MTRFWGVSTHLVLFILTLLLPMLQPGWFTLFMQPSPRVQMRELKAVVIANNGFRQVLPVNAAGFTSTFDPNGYGSFHWQFTNTTGQSLQNVQVVFFLDADLDRDSNTFFNEFGAFAGLSLPPGAPLGAIAATSWEIDEPGFLFGDIAQHVETATLDNTNAIPATVPDDVALALGFQVGNLAPNAGLSLNGVLSSTTISGLTQTDASSGAQLHFSGFVEPLSLKPTIVAETLSVPQGNRAATLKIATVSEKDAPMGGLLVEILSPPAGITLAEIKNPDGMVSAVVTVSCVAPLGTTTVPLRVTGSHGETATANLIINVIANSPPALGGYAGVEMLTNRESIIRPSVVPFDSGVVVSLQATATGFTGSINADLATGSLRILSTGITGTYTVRVTAVDNCGAQTTVSLSLLVKKRIEDCISPNCPDLGPYPEEGLMSGQRRGAVLFYNLYTSSLSNPSQQDTRLNLTNLDQGKNIVVHLFFVDGKTCSAADSFVCLTPGQTLSFLASEYDPGVTGYLIAVTVDRITGCPIKFNGLVGDEYVKLESGHAANVGAQTASAIAAVPDPNCTPVSTTATLRFDGVSYNALSQTVAISNLQSLREGNRALLILNRVGGDLTESTAPLGSVNGLLYDDQEKGFSFTFLASQCQFTGIFSDNFPRTAPRFSSVIPAGHSGWMRLWTTGDVGLMGAVINASTNAGGYNQGHNLHILTVTTKASLTIPVIAPPGC